MNNEATKPKGPSGLTVFFWIVGLLVLAFVVYMGIESSKPVLRAEVSWDGQSLEIRNRNAEPWNNVEVMLNDIFAGYVESVPGKWDPGEAKTLPLNKFTGRLNHQAFDPAFESIREVIILADSHQLVHLKPESRERSR